MKKKPISRRQFLKRTGALVVSFSISGPATRLLAQSPGLPAAEPEAASLDSWLAVAQDGSVTVFTSKVDLGTGIETAALSQIVAEELDVPFQRIKMDVGDTAKAVDQGRTSASRTIERTGPQLRQAAAAGRQELLKLASAHFQAGPTACSLKRSSLRLSGQRSCRPSRFSSQIPLAAPP